MKRRTGSIPNCWVSVIQRICDTAEDLAVDFITVQFGGMMMGTGMPETMKIPEQRA